MRLHNIFLTILILSVFPAQAEETCHAVKSEGVFPTLEDCPDDVVQLMERERLCYRFLQGGWTDDQIDLYVASHKDLIPYHCKGVPCALQNMLTHKYQDNAPVKNALLDALTTIYHQDTQKIIHACEHPQGR